MSSTSRIFDALGAKEQIAKADLLKTCVADKKLKQQQSTLELAKRETEASIGKTTMAGLLRNHLHHRTMVSTGIEMCEKQSVSLAEKLNTQQHNLHVLSNQRNMLVMRAGEEASAADKKADTAATEDFNTYNIPTFGGGDGLT